MRGLNHGENTTWRLHAEGGRYVRALAADGFVGRLIAELHAHAAGWTRRE